MKLKINKKIVELKSNLKRLYFKPKKMKLCKKKYYINTCK